MKYLFSIFTFSFFCISMIFAQQEMLILNRGKGQILSVKLANPNSPKILRGNTKESKISRALDLVLYQKDKKLLWVDGTSRSIQRANNEAKAVVTFDTDTIGLAVDLEVDWINDNIYWINHERETIFRASLIEENKNNLNLGKLNKPSSLAISPIQNRLFWTDLLQQNIHYSTLEGDSVRQFQITVTDYPIRLLVDDVHQKLYWSSDADHNIGRCNFDGSDQEVFYQGVEEEHPYGMFINQNDEKLYWADYGSDKIMRANLDGSEVEEVIGELDDPIAIVIQDVPGNQQLQNPDGISEIGTTKAEISIFPNPSYNDITLVLSNTEEENSQIIIYNQVGKIVKQLDRSGTVHRIKTEDLPGGLYYCKVKIGGQELQKQFVLIK